MNIQFNKLILCFVLWLGVELCSIVVAVIHRQKGRKQFERKKQYLKRLTMVLPDSTNTLGLLQEIYYTVNDSKLRKIVLKAIKKQEREIRIYDIPVGFKYIESKLGCNPMYKIHTALSNMEKKEGCYVDVCAAMFSQDFYEWIDEWQLETDWLLREKARQRLRGLVEKSIILFANLFIYLKVNGEISLLTFVIVNTIGLIMFIVLDYDCYIVDSKKRARNPAEEIRQTKKAMTKTKLIRSLYQLIAGLGLIVNITMFVNLWMAQEALF